MLSSRNILALSGLLSILIACIFSLGVSADVYAEEVPSVYSQRGQSSEKTKKMMNQISCHCCSNSFNSHCCLQCMQRVGKRSDLGTPFNMNALKELSADTGKEIADILEDDLQQADQGSLEFNTLMCSCCMLQMQRHPFADDWPCCTQCQARFKRSASNGQTEEQVKSDKA